MPEFLIGIVHFFYTSNYSLQSFNDIENVIIALNDKFFCVMKSKNYSVGEIKDSFKEITNSFN